MDADDTLKKNPVVGEKSNNGSKPTGEGVAESTKSAPSVAGQGEKKPVLAKASKGIILLVEDDLPMVKMYSTRFKMEGYEVVVANDGEVGLAKAQQLKPRVVLLDLMIPKMGGMEVLERIRKDPSIKDLKVLILSNLSQEKDIARAKELGVKEFLIKSNYTPTQIAEVVKKYLS